MEAVSFTLWSFSSQVSARRNKTLIVHFSNYLIRTKLPIIEIHILCWLKYELPVD